MKYLKFTYVDSVTKISVYDAPATNGPVFPGVVGLEYVFALESKYPTNKPVFFGTCPVGSDTEVDGVLEIITLAEFEETRSAELEFKAAQARQYAKDARANAVSRIKVTTAAGLVFDGDEVSQNRMSRAILTLQATETPSTLWVLADNTVIQVTAAQLIEALALAGAAQSQVWVI